MNKKGQEAMEFLMNYGWAILIVLLAIGALVYFGVLDPEQYIPKEEFNEENHICLECDMRYYGEYNNGDKYNVTIKEIHQIGECTEEWIHDNFVPNGTKTEMICTKHKLKLECEFNINSSNCVCDEYEYNIPEKYGYVDYYNFDCIKYDEDIIRFNKFSDNLSQTLIWMASYMKAHCEYYITLQKGDCIRSYVPILPININMKNETCVDWAYNETVFYDLNKQGKCSQLVNLSYNNKKAKLFYDNYCCIEKEKI